ncbi:hypothetical protein FRB94_006681 [Tulasnella sp. JGI-2019a]|nr:hypothetical protein FRB94_006681 [Tulasnella sp. JGI-2019a]
MATTNAPSPSGEKPTSINEALKTLEVLRTRHVRASERVLENTDFLFENNVDVQKKLGDDYWAFLEQLAMAAMDLGREGLADDCILRLEERFPSSPRVQVLQGMRREAAGKLEEALKIYDLILEEGEANAGIWKRRAAVYRQLGETQLAVEDLCEYLDTFYTDVEGWLELADIYSSVKDHTHALQSLSHAMVLAPQNPFYVLQFAQAAATNEEFTLALRMYLRTVEMVESDSEDDKFEHDANGVVRQAWLGVKTCTTRLLVTNPAAMRNSARANDVDATTPLTSGELEALDELASERVAGGNPR